MADVYGSFCYRSTDSSGPQEGPRGLAVGQQTVQMCVPAGAACRVQVMCIEVFKMHYAKIMLSFIEINIAHRNV